MKAKFKMDIKDFIRSTQKASAAVGKEAFAAIDKASKKVLQQSIEEVPVNTGTLQSSADRDINETPGKVEGIISYGVGNPVNPENKKLVSEYMVMVHEDLSIVHPNGKAKFLEDPTRRVQQELVEDYGDRIKVTMEAIFNGK